MNDSRLRILFASVHSYLDPSSGAAVATRDLLELLAARGHECCVLTAGILDYRSEMDLNQVIARLGAPFRRLEANVEGNAARSTLFDLSLNGVDVTIMRTSSSRSDTAPSGQESRAFLMLAKIALARFQPHVLLTYGGHTTSLSLMRLARAHNVAVAFHLHNFAYDRAEVFTDATAVLVPTEHSRRYYKQRLGLDCTAIEPLINPGRVISPLREPAYVTFVNPSPEKGVAIFARIAADLGHRRPDIPLLVVEGRSGVDSLGGYGVDLSLVSTVHRMANVLDPRNFWRVTRIALVPSLWRENAALVAREALLNGIPVLASDRGGLPETLGNAGFVFSVPAHYTASSRELPTSDEIRPWTTTVERLWDEPTFEARHQEAARLESHRWDVTHLVPKYEAFFRHLATTSSSKA